MSKARFARTAWALKLRAGYGGKLDAMSFILGDCSHPCRTRLFETRREAREVLWPLARAERGREDGFRYYLGGKIVRVQISVREIGSGD